MSKRQTQTLVAPHRPRDPGLQTPALEVRGVRKVFGGTTALRGVTLDIAAGTIHSLVGENGAGKSTLLGVLAGRVAPTSGEVYVSGVRVESASPRSSRAAGVVAIYQELTIIRSLSAMANVFLADPHCRTIMLDRKRMRARFLELSRQVGARIDPDAKATTLSVADQQMLEVMRALDADARIMIFDEHTATLPIEARQKLLQLMRQLRDDGVMVIFVSHNLEEVLDVSDQITVFRDGSLVTTDEASKWTKPKLIEAMLGEVGAAKVGHGGKARSAPASSAEALRCVGVSLPGALDRVSITLRKGEILGIAGLVGSGRSTLLRTIGGLEASATGRLVVGGIERELPRSARRALKLGIVLLPEDRKVLGLVGGMTASDNIVMGRLRAASTWGWTSQVRKERAARAVGATFGLDDSVLGRLARNLSGGNQQKLLLARSALIQPEVLLADEPTRGIDVGAKSQIRATLRRMADAGTSVLMVSSEHEELLEVADRLVVLSRGRVTAEFDNREGQVREHDLLQAAFVGRASDVA
jgi:ABC-type sugar transport system ATPase subunit